MASLLTKIRAKEKKKLNVIWLILELAQSAQVEVFTFDQSRQALDPSMQKNIL